MRQIYICLFPYHLRRIGPDLHTTILTQLLCVTQYIKLIQACLIDMKTAHQRQHFNIAAWSSGLRCQSFLTLPGGREVEGSTLRFEGSNLSVTHMFFWSRQKMEQQTIMERKSKKQTIENRGKGLKRGNRRLKSKNTEGTFDFKVESL